jgi:Fe-S-cluster formation regulator IscX/YfhJ
MKQNLMIQFVYPDYELPQEYHEAIKSIDHNKIIPALLNEQSADVIVFEKWKEFSDYNFSYDSKKSVVLRTIKIELFENYEQLIPKINRLERLNIVISDIDSFNDNDFLTYEQILAKLKTAIKDCCQKGELPQLNLLTDRIMLEKMNNCNAGIENITLAPNGKFYPKLEKKS